MKEFTQEISTDKQPATLLSECISEWTGQLSGYNYKLTTQSEVGLTFHKRYTPWWLLFLILLLFPLGLLFLLVKSDATITATFTPDGGGTRLLVTGRAPKEVIRAFSEMEV